MTMKQPASNYMRLEKTARAVRRSIIRSLAAAGSGHTAGSLSVVDILTVLYFEIMHCSAENPEWNDRDIFVMSNGHCAPALYAVLAERGFFPPSELRTLRQFGSRLQGHPERMKLPGLETTSGPLGCGLSQAAGMSYAMRFLNNQPHRLVYCLMGDGELDEGNVWEAAMFAAKYRLGNLTAIVDYNQIQIGGNTDDIMPLGNLSAKWRSFGWCAQEIDGHNIAELVQTLRRQTIDGQPRLVVARTIPGRGVDFMEYDYHWHGKVPDAAQAARALAQLEDPA